MNDGIDDIDNGDIDRIEAFIDGLAGLCLQHGCVISHLDENLIVQTWGDLTIDAYADKAAIDDFIITLERNSIETGGTEL